MGKRRPRKSLTKRSLRRAFCFLLALVLVFAFWTRPARWHLGGRRAGLICPALAASLRRDCRAQVARIPSRHGRRALSSSARDRRRTRRIRGGLADRRERRSRRAARDAAAAHDRGPQERRARGTRLLEFVPLRRQRTQCRRAPARGNASAEIGRASCRERV